MNEELEFLYKRKRQGSLMARLVGLTWEKIRSPFTWLAWRIWGRRQAIRRMQELAGLTPEAKYPDSGYLQAPEKVGYIQRQPPLPRPDVADDVN